MRSLQGYFFPSCLSHIQMKVIGVLFDTPVSMAMSTPGTEKICLQGPLPLAQSAVRSMDITARAT